jgi:F-type H+-transporting ATPase subunit b
MNIAKSLLILLIALVAWSHATGDVWAEAESTQTESGAAESEAILLVPYGEQGELSSQTDAVHAATADAEAAAHSSTAEGGHEKKSTGLPQLDPTWFASQIFWLLITFTTLYVVFSRNVLPALSGVIETRRENIQHDLDQAETLRDQAESVHKAYEAILNNAHQKTSDLAKNVELEIKDKANASANTFRDRATKEIQAMEQSIEKAKRDAMDEMTTIAAEIASQAAKKIVGISTDVSQAKTVVQNINKKAA